MKPCIIPILFLLCVSLTIQMEYDFVDCDWENTIEACFEKVAIAVQKEEDLMQQDIADLQAKNDEYSKKLDGELANLNSRLDSLNTELNTMQSDLQKKFDAVNETTMFSDIEKEIDALDKYEPK